MNKPNSITSKRPGFTLVELLVVITIIAVLAALAVVSTGKVRATAEKATGISRMRNLGAANALYAADNSGKFVPMWFRESSGELVDWRKNLQFNSLLMGEGTPNDNKEAYNILPDAVHDPVVLRKFKSTPEYYQGNLGKSYAINSLAIEPYKPGSPRYADPGHYSGVTQAYLDDPGRTMSFITCSKFNNPYEVRLNWETDPQEGPTFKVAYRYNDRALAVFFDGHVEEISISQMKEIDATKGGKDGIFWSGKR